MAFAQTAWATQAAAGGNPVTMDFDCNGGNLLVLGICREWTPRTGGAPTYDGVAMTDSPEGVVDSTDLPTVEMWYLVNPAGGNNVISIPNAGAPQDVTPIASAWSGVDTANPLNTSNSDWRSPSQNPSVTVTTSATDKLIIDIMMSEHDDVPTGNSHTLIVSQDNGTETVNAQYTFDDGTGGIALHWTVDWSRWAMIVCAFNPEGVVPPPPRRVFLIF